jgi:hypothetical protein
LGARERQPLRPVGGLLEHLALGEHPAADRRAIQRVGEDGGEDVLAAGGDCLLLELVVRRRLRVDAECGECCRDL